MGSDVDAALLDRLAADPDGGFAALLDAYGGLVYTIALRVSGCRADADDLAQETFVRAYDALRRYPPERVRVLRLRGWLTTITLNLWRNRLRAASRRPALRPLDPGIDPPDAAAGPESLMLDRDGTARWVRRLERLSERQRVPLVLRHVVGLSYAEIAEVLGRPVGTVRSNVSRGLARLRVLTTTDGEEAAS